MTNCWLDKGKNMNSRTQKLFGHMMALFVTLVWGVTFVFSKLALAYYTPLALMTLRFSLAYTGLWLLHPKWVKVKSLKEESLFIAAGLTGVLGYFYMENTALVYTTVSNVGLLLTAAPLLVAIVLHLFTDDESFHINLFYGFIIAMIGVGLVIYNGQTQLEVNPLGDFLALMAGLIWAFYSLALKKMDPSLSPLFITRRTFFYGALSGIICLVVFEGGMDLSPLVTTKVWINVVFLGLIGSMACFAMWNKSMKWIGANKTSSYLYLMPMFTMAASVIVLDEVITVLMLVGCALILLGVYVSENGLPFLQRSLRP